jgi:acetoin utilization deacetylase AcuC-like enzyme
MMLKIAYRKEYAYPLPENHRFPMEKYELLPQQLLYEGTVNEAAFFQPGALDEGLVLRVHEPDYFAKLDGLQLTEKEQKVSGFVHSSALIEREKWIMEGTRMCAEMALKTGAAMNIAGGTHHAFTNRAEGFCLLNDNAIAAQWLVDTKQVGVVLIVDLDVHQGNGTAQIFQGNNQVFTFSMHGKNNYPLKKEVSDLDVALPDGTKDQTYLYELEKALDTILCEIQPDFVFYQCGVDVLESDVLGRLSLSLNGCMQRDLLVFEKIRELAVPIVCNMGGGYSKDIKQIIAAHANTFRAIQQVLF